MDSKKQPEKIKILVGKWVPVSERLPSETELKRNYNRNTDATEFNVMIEGATIPTTLKYTKNGNWTDEREVEVYKVVAWANMPEPYQEKKLVKK